MGLGQLYLTPSNPDKEDKKETVGFFKQKTSVQKLARPLAKFNLWSAIPVRWEYLPHSAEMQQNGLHCFHQICFILYLSRNLGKWGHNNLDKWNPLSHRRETQG